MLLPAPYSNKGFTLIEFLVAIVIMMVGLLALLQSVNIAIETNGGNKKRTQAVAIADQVMAQERSKAFTALTSAVVSPNTKQYSAYAGLAYVNYSVVEKVTKIATTTKDVQITVTWKDKKQRKSHSLTTVMGNYDAK